MPWFLLGLFLLAGGCGGLGTAAGYLLADSVAGGAPVSSLGRAVGLGVGVGLWYPATGIVAVGRILGSPAAGVLGGVPPSLVWTGMLAGVLLVAVWVGRQGAGTRIDSRWRRDLLFAGAFAVALVVGFEVLYPVLVVPLAPPPG